MITGRIYMIYSDDHNNIYIGSTECNLARRLQLHSSNFKRYLKNQCNNVTSFSILAMGNYKIKLIEEAEFTSLDHMRTREGVVTKEYKSNIQYNIVNKKIEGRTMKQYQIDNAEKIKAFSQQYYIDNKHRIKQYQLDNAEKIKAQIKANHHKCSCGGKYLHQQRKRHFKSNKHIQYIVNNINSDI